MKNETSKTEQPCTLHGVISCDSEAQEIEQILNRLRDMRNKNKFEDGYRTYYNAVCDRLDVLHSKLLHGL